MRIIVALDAGKYIYFALEFYQLIDSYLDQQELDY